MYSKCIFAYTRKVAFTELHYPVTDEKDIEKKHS